MNAKAMVALLGPDTPITVITSETLAEAMDELEDLGNTGATINKKMSTVNVMLKGAKARGWLKYVPDVQRRREASQRIYWYTEEEERAMLDACYRLGLPGLADFITFAVDTGFRRSELLKLKVADYHEGVVRLHAGETKNDDGRSIPATEPVKAIIEKAKGVGATRVFEGLTEAVLRSQWAHLRESLGKSEDPKYIVHVLRHTTATRLAIAGASAPQIMAYMGHRAIQTSMRYIHLTTNHLTGVAALLTRTAPAKPALKVVGGGL
jgi:integrase